MFDIVNVKISQNFVAFSEYMNFKKLCLASKALSTWVTLILVLLIQIKLSVKSSS